MTDLICEITGADRRFMPKTQQAKLNQIEQIKPIYTKFPFVCMPKYEDGEQVELLNFLTKLFKIMIGEGKDVSDWGSIDCSLDIEEKGNKKASDSDQS